MVEPCHGILCSLKLNPSISPAGSQSRENGRRGGKGKIWKEQVDLSFISHVWLPLVAAINTSLLMGATPLTTVGGVRKTESRLEKEGKNWRKQLS